VKAFLVVAEVEDIQRGRNNAPLHTNLVEHVRDRAGATQEDRCLPFQALIVQIM